MWFVSADLVAACKTDCVSFSADLVVAGNYFVFFDVSFVDLHYATAFSVKCMPRNVQGNPSESWITLVSENC